MLHLYFPPDPSREGEPWGLLIDAFGNDYYKELTRVMGHSDEGWIYYSFTNPATGRDEPKASYVKALDWGGTPGAIGAGVYRRDIPGTNQWQRKVTFVKRVTSFGVPVLIGAGFYLD